MIYVTTFFSLLFKFWWIFPALFAAYYLYYFFVIRRSKKPAENIEVKEKKKTYEDLKPEEKFHPHDC